MDSAKIETREPGYPLVARLKHIIKLDLWLLLLPLLLFGVSQLGLFLRGPYYMGQNFDPDYVYLFNSLNLIFLDSPGHFDHPGTPVQFVGAIVILIRYLFVKLFHSDSSLHLHVLQNSESYLHTINIVFNLLIASTMYFGGIIISRLSSSRLSAFIFQLTPFLYATLLLSTTRVTPEPFLLVPVLWVVVLLYGYSDCSYSDKKRIISAVILGTLIGLGCASKITFMPLVLLVFIFTRWREIAAAFISSLLAFLVFTIPIMNKYAQFFEWINDLLLRDGIYGGGEIGLPSIEKLIINTGQLLKSEPAFFILLGVGFFCLILRITSRGSEESKHINLRMLTVLNMIFLVHTLITIKHPPIHYMTASLGLSVLMVILFFRNPVKKSDSQLLGSPRFLTGLWLIFALVISTINSIALFREIRNYNEEAEKIQLLIQQDYSQCTIAHYYRSSTLTYALSFGNDFVPARFSDSLRELYPQAVSYDKWVDTFFRFSEPWSWDEAKHELSGGNCLLISGSVMSEEWISSLPVEVRPIFIGKQSAVYQIVTIKNVD